MTVTPWTYEQGTPGRSTYQRVDTLGDEAVELIVELTRPGLCRWTVRDEDGHAFADGSAPAASLAMAAADHDLADRQAGLPAWARCDMSDDEVQARVWGLMEAAGNRDVDTLLAGLATMDRGELEHVAAGLAYAAAELAQRQASDG